MSAQPESRFVAYHLPFAAAAWGLFVVSFFLPAYDENFGWQCALLSLNAWVWPDDALDPVRIHLMLLSLPNLFMIMSPFFVLRAAGAPRTLRWLRRFAAVCVLLTATFILEFARGNELKGLHIGYFVWVFSFGLLGMSFVRGAVGLQGEARPG
jgi:hypothetical protein